jgi:hypothetical protein
MKQLRYLIVLTLLFSACSPGRNLSKSKQEQIRKENFHIYLLLGQSNMSGRGVIEGIDTLVHPKIYMLNADTAWVLARDPIHFDKPKTVGTGLGLSFAKKMIENDTSITIGLIPCAKGGSAMKDWTSNTYHEETESYPYDEAIDRIKKGMEKGVIKGVLWHQGESDCKEESDVLSYKEKFLAFKDSLEEDLGIEEIPIIVGEVGYFLYRKRPLAEDFNAVLNEIALENNCIGIVKSDSLTSKRDKIHFDSKSLRELGVRYADEMIILQSKCTSPKQHKKRAKKRL